MEEPGSHRRNRNFKASVAVRIFMVFLVILAIWEMSWVWLVACCIMILVSFLPSILTKDLKTTLPWQLDLLMASANLLHFEGEVFNAYPGIQHFDVLTHFITSLFVGFFALVFIFILNEYWDKLRIDAYTMAFFVVLICVMVGVMWEFLEWLSDYFLDSGLQYSVDDVIKDLFVNTMGGLVMALIGVRLILKGKLKKYTDLLGEQMDRKVINKPE